MERLCEPFRTQIRLADTPIFLWTLSAFHRELKEDPVKGQRAVSKTLYCVEWVFFSVLSDITTGVHGLATEVPEQMAGDLARQQDRKGRKTKPAF